MTNTNRLEVLNSNRDDLSEELTWANTACSRGDVLYEISLVDLEIYELTVDKESFL